MPYGKINELPRGVKDNLPKSAQEIYKEASGGALDEYGEEERRPRRRLEHGRDQVRERRRRTVEA